MDINDTGQFKSNCTPAICLLLFTLASSLAIAAPENKPLAFWSGSNEKNTTIVDHTSWQKLLDTYLDSKHPSGINRFNYAAVNAKDQKVLSNYIKQLQAINPRELTRAEQKAFWINLYNALTVELIVKNYPIKSITKLGKSIFAFGPWDDILIAIQGQELTLNNIEHGILRPFYNDNRIHYAVNCASMSCPNLSSIAYTSENTDQLLEQGARQYVNHSRGVSFEEEELKVSSIYHWYKDDFGGNNKSLIEHLSHYAEPDLAKRLKNYQGDVEHGYDWNLNKP
ncbi:MAG: DUF547 domain-containing protein [marine bacterium B5-7]|nr:MAG: DUF547 domain-containing protein [marine bacterium B5-7]